MNKTIKGIHINPYFKNLKVKMASKVFGLDHLIQANIESYLFDKAKTTQVPVEKLIIRIWPHNQEVLLFVDGNSYERLTNSNLFRAVTGNFPPDMMELHKLSEGISQFIGDIASDNNIADQSQIKALIYFRKGIRIEIFNKSELLKNVTVRELINSFVD